MNVLVTGGAGYIGSHAVRALVRAGHAVTVLDNLSKGHREAVDPTAEFVHGDIGDSELVSQTLVARKIEAVLHFAASIEVAESVQDPVKYYRNNFGNAIALLDAMRAQGVKQIVFSSTAAVYGNPCVTPIPEDHPRDPINPYGRSKMMTEMAIEDCTRAWGLGACILRYFNVAGASTDAVIGEDHEPESHLIPRILLSLVREGTGRVQIFGTDYPTPDGTCVRDYVHVEDLVEAHVLALSKIEPGHSKIFNLGSESGFSVREVVAACRQVTGIEIQVDEMPRRSGDPAVLLASNGKAREILGWRPRYSDLKTILTHAFAWHRSRPFGFNGNRRRRHTKAVQLVSIFIYARRVIFGFD